MIILSLGFTLVLFYRLCWRVEAFVASSMAFSQRQSFDTTMVCFETADPDVGEFPRGDDDNTKNLVEKLLQDDYPSFHGLLSLHHPRLLDTLFSSSSYQVTLFAPTEAAFTNLGPTKLRQMRDQRNDEIVAKIVLYHIINDDAVAAARLRTEDWTSPPPAPGASRPITVRGLITMSGDSIPVGRRTEKQSLWPANDETTTTDDDDDVVIGPNARIQKSIKLRQGRVYIHEVDALVSPEVLWRYCDQLQIRLPGL